MAVWGHLLVSGRRSSISENRFFECYFVFPSKFILIFFVVCIYAVYFLNIQCYFHVKYLVRFLRPPRNEFRIRNSTNLKAISTMIKGVNQELF